MRFVVGAPCLFSCILCFHLWPMQRQRSKCIAVKYSKPLLFGDPFRVSARSEIARRGLKFAIVKVSNYFLCLQVPEGHERLVGGQRCCDLAAVLVKGTWAAVSTHATTRSTAPLKRTRVRSSRQGDVNRPPSGNLDEKALNTEAYCFGFNDIFYSFERNFY